jgi:hypothetical protein
MLAEIDNPVDLFYCEPETTVMTKSDLAVQQSARGTSVSAQSPCCRLSR